MHSSHNKERRLKGALHQIDNLTQNSKFCVELKFKFKSLSVTNGLPRRLDHHRRFQQSL